MTILLADLGSPLTPRERECLTLASNGKTHAEIGRGIGISFHTVKNHLDSARIKLGAANTAQACALYARTKGSPEPKGQT